MPVHGLMAALSAGVPTFFSNLLLGRSSTFCQLPTSPCGDWKGRTLYPPPSVSRSPTFSRQRLRKPLLVYLVFKLLFLCSQCFLLPGGFQGGFQLLSGVLQFLLIARCWMSGPSLSAVHEGSITHLLLVPLGPALRRSRTDHSIPRLLNLRAWKMEHSVFGDAFFGISLSPGATPAKTKSTTVITLLVCRLKFSLYPSLSCRAISHGWFGFWMSEKIRSSSTTFTL